MSNVFKSIYEKELERELNNKLIEHAGEINKINCMVSYINNVNELYLTCLNSKNIKLLKGIYLLTADIVLTNKYLTFAKGAILKPANGVAITINSNINASRCQIFDLSAGGTIAGTPTNVEIYPEWFNDNLQDSINFCQLSKKTLSLSPNKTYTVTNSGLPYASAYGVVNYGLRISNTMKIKGNKARLEYNTLTDTYNCLLIDGVEDFVADDFLINGTALSVGTVWERAAIVADNCNRAYINRLEVYNCAQAIKLYYCTNSVVEQCYSHDADGSGIILFNTNKCKINNCHVKNCTDGHLSLYGAGENNHVVNCKVEETRIGHTGEQGITVESEKFSTIDTCEVTGFYYGIDIKNAADGCNIINNKSYGNRVNCVIRGGDPQNGDTPSHNINIINNDFTEPCYYDISGDVTTSRYCLQLLAGSKHTVDGNRFGRNANKYGDNPDTMAITSMISVKSNSTNDGDQNEGLIIKGNHFIFREFPHAAANDRVATGYGIRLYDCTAKDVGIYSNNFYDNNSYTFATTGIRIEDASGYNIKGNTFIGFNNATDAYCAISIDNDIAEALYDIKHGNITNNDFDNTAGSIYINYGKNINIKSNHFKSSQQYRPIIKVRNSKLIKVYTNSGISTNGTNGDKFIDADNTNSHVYVKHNDYVWTKDVADKITNNSVNGITLDNELIEYSLL